MAPTSAQIDAQNRRDQLQAERDEQAETHREIADLWVAVKELREEVTALSDVLRQLCDAA